MTRRGRRKESTERLIVRELQGNPTGATQVYLMNQIGRGHLRVMWALRQMRRAGRVTRRHAGGSLYRYMLIVRFEDLEQMRFEGLGLHPTD